MFPGLDFHVIMIVMKNLLKLLFIVLFALFGCSQSKDLYIQSVTGPQSPSPSDTWLSHEHILVDFIGAESIDPDLWEHEEVIDEVLPYILKLKDHGVKYFVEATPNFLGRDVVLLEKISKQTGLKILTNTGLYGALDNKYIPEYAYRKTAEELSEMWINEYENGIGGTAIKPGFIKISVDASDTLDSMHQKLVAAAALTHLKTGLTIASHTGEAKGLWPQLEILNNYGVAPKAFIWVHAQNENDHNNYLKAAETGCWISLDGLGWELEKYVEKLLFAKNNEMLDQILISHDAGWYDPQKEEQPIQPYTNIFEKLYPKLISKGFTEEDFHQLVSNNPSQAFSIRIRKGSL